jgi:hypothetical protein
VLVRRYLSLAVAWDRGITPAKLPLSAGRSGGATNGYSFFMTAMGRAWDFQILLRRLCMRVVASLLSRIIGLPFLTKCDITGGPYCGRQSSPLCFGWAGGCELSASRVAEARRAAISARNLYPACTGHWHSTRISIKTNARERSSLGAFDADGLSISMTNGVSRD